MEPAFSLGYRGRYCCVYIGVQESGSCIMGWMEEKTLAEINPSGGYW